MKIKIIGLIPVLFLFISSHKNQLHNSKLQRQYIAKTKNNFFAIKFIDFGNKTLLFYNFYYDDGKYLNTPADSSDYAGYFYKKDILKNQINLKIKDYRGILHDSTSIYNLKINLLTDSTLRWTIERTQYGNLVFVPNDILFKCIK